MPFPDESKVVSMQSRTASGSAASSDPNATCLPIQWVCKRLLTRRVSCGSGRDQAGRKATLRLVVTVSGPRFLARYLEARHEGIW